MPDLESVTITTVVTAPVAAVQSQPQPVDVIYIKFILDEVIDFIETLKLSGEPLRHAGVVLQHVEELRSEL